VFLIGTLHRLDILPVGDLVIKKKVIEHFNITPKGKSLISPKDMEAVCEVWRPYRSIASWYLWQWKISEG
jgi:DNA-3-methyladenine glycosylase II